MSDSEKKFFENLSDAMKENVAEETDVELAKAGSAALKKRSEEAVDEIGSEDEGQIAIDVYQTPSHIVVESPIAGVAPDDIDVAITADAVTIRGKRVREQHIRDEDYVYQECYWGRFSRSVVLPQEVDADNAEATIKNGVLIVKIPKLNRSKSKKVKVKPE
jgi:HSP20 family protein